MVKSADWKGRVQRVWSFSLRWPFIRREWGRWCYRTNCNGDTLAAWFEPEASP